MTTTNAAFDFLQQRSSVAASRLQPPAPDPESLKQIVASAMRVPDHGALTPWRIIEIALTDRQRLAEAIDARHREIDPQVSSAKLDKDFRRFADSPLLLVVVARIRPEHKVPVQEQLLSGGCVCFGLLQAAQALGFAGQWLTGWAAYDDGVAKLLGLAEHERVIGFVHLGSTDQATAERPRPDLATHFQIWQS